MIRTVGGIHIIRTPWRARFFRYLLYQLTDRPTFTDIVGFELVVCTHAKNWKIKLFLLQIQGHLCKAGISVIIRLRGTCQYGNIGIVYLTTGASQTLAPTAGTVNFSGTSAALVSVLVSVCVAPGDVDVGNTVSPLPPA